MDKVIKLNQSKINFIKLCLDISKKQFETDKKSYGTIMSLWLIDLCDNLTERLNNIKP